LFEKILYKKHACMGRTDSWDVYAFLFLFFNLRVNRYVKFSNWTVPIIKTDNSWDKSNPKSLVQYAVQYIIINLSYQCWAGIVYICVCVFVYVEILVIVAPGPPFIFCSQDDLHKKRNVRHYCRWDYVILIFVGHTFN
jgi:hypothetical protein